MAVTALGLAACLANQVLAVAGRWSTVDGSRVLDAVATSGANGAQVDWLATPGVDADRG
jgi:hypothetical protein